jgi:hypothetical protein
MESDASSEDELKSELSPEPSATKDESESESKTKIESPTSSPDRKARAREAIAIKRQDDRNDWSSNAVKESVEDKEEKPFVAEDNDSELSEVLDEPREKKLKNKKVKLSSIPEARASKAKDEQDEKPRVKMQDSDIDSDSSLSSLVDETPKRKRKSKEPSAGRSKTSKKPTGESTDDAEVRKLQGQLVKCGVRKIWGIELKECRDSKAKIRHLRQMLKDIGIEGRFSEAKAREIREARELAADLAAVQEMESYWGADSKRPSRGRATKSMKEESDADEDEEEVIPVSKGKRSNKYNADLAFLDDESDSE